MGVEDLRAEEDDRLARRSRGGDPAALAELYRRHAAALLRYLERHLRDRADAEDVLHETFVRVFEGRGTYDGRGQFRSWLFTIATRLALDAHRQRRRHANLLQQHFAAADSPGSWDTAFGSELTASIRAALAALPHDEAVAFHLRIQDGFSYREMAAICAAPEGTLRSRVHHVLRRLRAALLSEPTPRTATHHKEKNDACESS